MKAIFGLSLKDWGADYLMTPELAEP